MSINMDELLIGNKYSRPQLARLWRYKDWHAIGRGIVTPRDQNIIILFITKEKQDSLTHHIAGDRLYMEGESGHRTDKRLILSPGGRDKVYLFYRKTHQELFAYYGEVRLTNYKLNTGHPSKFVFKILLD